jgi:hypothetical protein
MIFLHLLHEILEPECATVRVFFWEKIDEKISFAIVWYGAVFHSL